MEGVMELGEGRLKERMGVFPLALFFVVAMLWTGWLAALLKVFYAPAILAVSLAVTLTAWWFIRVPSGNYLETQDIRDRIALALALAIVAVVFVTGFWLFHESFGYRDESLYANNSIYLADNGNLPYPSLEGSDSRLFLNTVWNAELYGLMGMSGIRLTNVILACLALICVYMLVKEIAGSFWPALAALLLIFLSYPFAWFMRRTVNEVFFFSLCWICFYLLYRCLLPRYSFKIDLTLFMLIAPLLAFVRMEGLVILGVFLVASVYVILTRGYRARAYPKVLFVLLLILMIMSAYGGYKHLEKKYGGLEQLSESKSDGTVVMTKGNELRKHQAVYTFWVMLKFGILPALLLIPMFFVLLFQKRKNRVFTVLFLLAVLPFFYFFLKPNIYFDLPWFLRRFVAIVIPLAYISFSVVVFRLRKPQALAITAAYLALTVFISSPVLLLQDHRGTAALTADIAARIPAGGEVLVDRYALGDYGLEGLLKNRYRIETTGLNPWNRLDRTDVEGTEGIYLVTSDNDFQGYYDLGRKIFDETVTVEEVEIIYQTDVSIPFLLPTSELHRGGYGNTWLSVDYHVALTQVSVPTQVVMRDYRILIVRIRIAAGGG